MNSRDDPKGANFASQKPANARADSSLRTSRPGRRRVRRELALSAGSTRRGQLVRYSNRNMSRLRITVTQKATPQAHDKVVTSFHFGRK